MDQAKKLKIRSHPRENLEKPPSFRQCYLRNNFVVVIKESFFVVLSVYLRYFSSETPL